jgi:crotonobetainyl-CoA:carnitine CoA-transferase CaiB-like acyl-CoA transferase
MSILDAHKTRDDQYLMISAQSDEQWEGLLKLINKNEIIAEKWDAYTRNVKRRDDAEGWISEWVKTKTLEEGLKELEKSRIPATSVPTREQLKTHPQMLARELLVEIDDPDFGKLKGVRGIAPKLLGTPGMIDLDLPPSELGQHTSEVLSQMLGYSPEQIAELKEEGVV